MFENITNDSCSHNTKQPTVWVLTLVPPLYATENWLRKCIFFPYQFPVGPFSATHRELPSRSFLPHHQSWQQKHTEFLEVRFLRLQRQTLSCAAMILLTMIARVADGLPLSASIQEEEQVWVRHSCSIKGWLTDDCFVFIHVRFITV